jgi:hypothetical protein
MVIADLSFLRTTIKKGMEAGRNRWRMALQSGMFYLALETCFGPLHAVSRLGRFWHAFTLSGASETRSGYVSVSQIHLACVDAIWSIRSVLCMLSCCLGSLWDAFSRSRARDAFWTLWRRLKGLKRVLDTFTPSREFQTRSRWLHTVSRVPEVSGRFHAVSRISAAFGTPSRCLKHSGYAWNAFTSSRTF